jgi:hypothetical protein
VVQATETIKIILEKGASLAGRFLLCSAMDADFKVFGVRKSPQCHLSRHSACGHLAGRLL